MPRMRRVALPRLAMAVVTAFPIAAGIPGAIFSTQQVSRRPVLAARRCCEGVSTLCAITPGFASCSFPWTYARVKFGRTRLLNKIVTDLDRRYKGLRCSVKLGQVPKGPRQIAFWYAYWNMYLEKCSKSLRTLFKVACPLCWRHVMICTLRR